MSLVFGDVEGHILLRAHQGLIDEGDTRNPVAVRHLAVALDVVLTTREVPHKVAPVHKVELVGEEVAQVLGEGGLHDGGHLAATAELHRCALHLCPLLVGLHVRAAGAIHAGEQHVQLIHIFILRLVFRDVVAVLLILIAFDDSAPSGLSLLRDRHTGAILILALHLRHIGLSVEQRRLAVLLAGQVVAQGEDVLRGVLVHRRVGRRTDQRQGIRRVAHDNHQQADQDRVEQLDVYILLDEQEGGQCHGQDHGDHIAAADKGNTQQDDRQDEGDAHTHGMHLLAHGLPDGPGQDARQHEGEGIDTRVVGHAEDVDKQQLEVAADLHQALHHAKHHQANDGERDEQGDQRALQGGVGCLLIIVNQHDRRDTEQVQQVYADAQAHQIGNQDNPAIGMRLIGRLLPLQDQPEDNRRKQR